MQLLRTKPHPRFILPTPQVYLMLEDRPQRPVRVTTLLDDVISDYHILGTVSAGVPWQRVIFPYLNSGTFGYNIAQDIVLELVVYTDKVLLAVLHTNSADLVAVRFDEDVHLCYKFLL